MLRGLQATASVAGAHFVRRQIEADDGTPAVGRTVPGAAHHGPHIGALRTHVAARLPPDQAFEIPCGAEDEVSSAHEVRDHHAPVGPHDHMPGNPELARTVSAAAERVHISAGSVDGEDACTEFEPRRVQHTEIAYGVEADVLDGRELLPFGLCRGRSDAVHEFEVG